MIYELFFGLIVGFVAVKMLLVLAFYTDLFGLILGICAYTCLMLIIALQGIVTYGIATLIAMLFATKIFLQQAKRRKAFLRYKALRSNRNLKLNKINQKRVEGGVGC